MAIQTRISVRDLKYLKEKALVSPRKRELMIMHPKEYEGPQTIANFIFPDSYVRPHKHPYKEIWMPLTGNGVLLYFSKEGNLTEKVLLSRDIILYDEIPEDTFHSFIAFQPMCFSNVTPGPHDPENYLTYAEWAPDERSEEAKAYFENMKRIAGINQRDSL